MSYFIYSFVCLLIAIGAGVGFYFRAKSQQYPQKTAVDCHNQNIDPKNPKKCGAWTPDPPICWKGTIITNEKGTGCEKPFDVIALSLLILGGISFISSIVLLIMGFRHRKSGVSSNFSYHGSSCGSSE